MSALECKKTPPEEKPELKLVTQDNKITRHHSSEIDYSGYPPAGFAIRFAAASIDGIFFTVLSQMFLLPLNKFILPHFIQDELIIELIGLFLTIIFVVFYYALPIAKYGKTLGKKICKLRVINANLKPDISMGNAIIRETIGKGLSTSTFMIGYLIVLVRKDRRALHDFVANTIVVKIGNEER